MCWLAMVIRYNQNKIADVIWKYIREEYAYENTKIYSRKFALGLTKKVVEYLAEKENA